MNNFGKTALILLLAIQLSYRTVSAQRRLVRCAYYGEPHLIPFPTTFGGPQNNYLCLNSGPEILLQNSFLTISVVISPNGGHPIISYSLQINPTGGYPLSCTISGNLGSPFSSSTCPAGSPASANLVGSTLHVSHLTANIFVDIYFQVRNFDIYVAQPFPLVAQSRGVCVRFNCPLFQSGKRKKRQTIPPLISKICDIFINDALAQASNPVPSDVIKTAKSTCEYDINTTLDAGYGRSSVVAIIRGGLAGNPGERAYQQALLASDGTIQSVYCQAATEVNSAIASSDRVCNNNGGQTQCLEPIDLSSQCAGK